MTSVSISSLCIILHQFGKLLHIFKAKGWKAMMKYILSVTPQFVDFPLVKLWVMEFYFFCYYFH